MELARKTKKHGAVGDHPGSKRTYRLASKIQRRINSRNHPRFQQFVQRRTSTVFDVALKFNRSIQRRDIEVGRNLGNWILCWFNKNETLGADPSSNSPETPP